MSIGAAFCPAVCTYQEICKMRVTLELHKVASDHTHLSRGREAQYQGPILLKRRKNPAGLIV